MSASTKPSRIVTFEDGSVAVVHSDLRVPHVLEIIAVFFEARARETTPTEKTAALPSWEVSRAWLRHNGVSNRLRQHRN